MGWGRRASRSQLARAHLDACPDGVWWAPLATVRDPQLMLVDVERAIGATVALAEYVGSRRMLIAARQLRTGDRTRPQSSRRFWPSCPNLGFLVTSRELLRLEGERDYAPAPLSGSESGELFCERAGVAAGDAVDELCARLEGLPLAIELAAARAHLLTVTQILERLSRRLDLFSGSRDADARHATLRATIEWSHELLDPPELHLFARFAAFPGGATFDAVEAIADAEPDVCQSLLEKSLIRRTGDRLWMLEVIRDFAVERLEASGELNRMTARHYDHFLRFALSLNLTGITEHVRRPDLVAFDRDNFRAAMDRGEDAGDVVEALRLRPRAGGTADGDPPG